MNDYLWDRSGAPDPDVVALEERLRPFRCPPATAGADGDRPEAPPRTTGVPRAPWLHAAAAAALLSIGLGLALLRPTPEVLPYRVERLDGRAPSTTALCGGDRVTCDDGTRARIHVGDIGSVDLAPRTRVRVEPGRHDEEAGYRLFLERGTMEASIFSAPRVFQVGTPSGIAVDLGCIYSTTVEDDGRATLRVLTGAVSFEAEGRKVHVPSGAECRATPSRGPGTPCWSDRAPEWRDAVARIDEAPAPADEDLALVLAGDEERDTLTWFHLLDHPALEVRVRALDRIVAVVDGLGDAVDLKALRGGDPAAREALREELDWRW